MNNGGNNTGGSRTSNVAIERPTFQRLQRYCDGEGRGRRHVVTRVVEWFVDQDPTLQTLLVGGVSDEDRAQIAELVLARIADRDPPEGEGRAAS